MPITLSEFSYAFRQAAMNQGMEQAGKAYLQSMWRRANRGGDGWEDLAEGTPRRRRANPGTRFPILQDSGNLIRALIPGNIGNLVEPSAEGCLVGFSPDTYPYANQTGVSTFQQLAVVHALGLGENLPPRVILIEPEGEDIPAIADAATLGIDAALIHLS